MTTTTTQTTRLANNAPRFIVMTATAQVPSRMRRNGSYKRVAVIEIEAGFEGTPSMISERARGVARIVETWERCNVGKTTRSAFARAMAEAEALAAKLNAAC